MRTKLIKERRCLSNFFFFIFPPSVEQVSVQTGIPDRRSSQVLYVRIKIKLQIGINTSAGKVQNCILSGK